MLIKASAKYIRMSPRKIREAVYSLVGLSSEEAISRLKLLRKKSSKILVKLVSQAVANAQSNFKISSDKLKVKEILVEEGPRIKRSDKSHGARFDSGIIRKRFAHLKIVLESAEEQSSSVAGVIPKVEVDSSLPTSKKIKIKTKLINNHELGRKKNGE